MRKLACVVGILGVSLAFGCGTDSGKTTGDDGPEILPNLTVPPVPEHGIQVITPIVHDLQPGSDHEICTWSDAIVATSVDVKTTTGYQTEPGHHVVLYYTTQKQPAGTQRECTDNDMASFRYLAGNGKEGEPNEAPGNLVYRVPAGAQIVVNHHYLNATDQVMDGQSVINLYFAPEGGTYTPSGTTAFLNSQLVVAPGQTSQDQHCVIDREMKLWYFGPHMHRWGTHINIDLTQGDTKTRLFDQPWNDSFTFHPPELRFDPATPKIVHPGDQVDVHCEWNNDTGHDLGFGFEMCVAFGQFVDDKGTGSWACDGGQWTDF